MTDTPDRPRLPADRPVYSPFIWLVTLLPLVSVVLLPLWQPDFRYVTQAAGIATVDPLSILTPAYFLIIVAGFVIYALNALFAYRDWIWLKRQGVIRPFHWAWIFLYQPAYVVGRSVIVHRVAAPRGRAPIWVLIGVVALSFVVAIVWTAILVSSLVNEMGGTFGA